MCTGDNSDDDSRGGLDYVVFGIGMGTSLVLVGMVVRTLGPSLRYRPSRTSGEVLKAEELVAGVAWARFCSSLGAALALGGVFLLVVTGVVMALRLEDSAGMVSVGLALLAILALMALWTWTYIGRFGLYGIVVTRPRTAKPPREPRPSKEKKPKETPPVTDLPTPAMIPEPGEASVASASPSQPRTDHPKRSIMPWSTPAEPTAASGETSTAGSSTPGIDSTRSEVVNPSDAAALERILSEPDLRPADSEPPDMAPPEGHDRVEEPQKADDPPSGQAESVAEANPQIDPASVPAAPWNRRKHQRR